MQFFFKNIINDLKVSLTDKFDQNFDKKSFFGKAWENTKLPNQRGSLMMRTGKLRRSITAKQSNNSISWASSMPYASLHNEGGEVIVTDKMKRYFWAMFYKTNGSKKPTPESAMWKALALQKTGTIMKVKQRQFIGDHPVTRQEVARIVDLNMKELEKEIFKKLKK